MDSKYDLSSKPCSLRTTCSGSGLLKLELVGEDVVVRHVERIFCFTGGTLHVGGFEEVWPGADSLSALFRSAFTRTD